jgi:hypothetical protein
MNGGRDIELLGLHVMRLDRIGIGWGTEQRTSVRLEIPGFIQCDDHRPIPGVQAIGRCKGEG